MCDNLEMFDLVVNIHVLEHVYDMVDFLKRLNSITNEGGFLIIEVPKFSINLNPPFSL